ncbi:EI24 domain-containing protein [Pseudaestuariivita atlantica]|uniref:Membrane protein n=1 Tax=Pseudaestuariivita atlantica TaxID=1317121 RepID=A0A0L1JPG1_9RHOB|nr:EI24 domain-containing protein [Pseudaestuariivita atlantica]KNG93616.1 membrane protein [Pseudaestuariivita atlantica]
MILGAFFRALGQVGDPAFRRVLFIGIGLTIALLIAACTGFIQIMGWLLADGTGIEWIDNAAWIGDLATWGTVFLFLGLSVFLMVPVASAITSMFLDEVARAVEAKHYPHLPPAPRVPFWDSVRDTVNFLGILIAANVVALVLYVFLPFAAIFIFWGLNGFLLGREYFTLAAMRRLGREGARAARRENAGTIWLAGTLMAIPLTVPLLNLVIPILGAATFTHIFHAVSGTRPQPE